MAKKSKSKSRKKSGSPIRDAIHAAVKAKQLKGSDLVDALEGRVSRTAVYRFLADGGTTDVETAEAFFDVLGLSVATK